MERARRLASREGIISILNHPDIGETGDGAEAARYPEAHRLGEWINSRKPSLLKRLGMPPSGRVEHSPRCTSIDHGVNTDTAMFLNEEPMIVEGDGEGEGGIGSVLLLMRPQKDGAVIVGVSDTGVCFPWDVRGAEEKVDTKVALPMRRARMETMLNKVSTRVLCGDMN